MGKLRRESEARQKEIEQQIKDYEDELEEMREKSTDKVEWFNKIILKLYEVFEKGSKLEEANDEI